MVWVVIGRRLKTTNVDGGVALERNCPVCSEQTEFRERRPQSGLRLPFLDVFDHRSQRVMACSECGTLFATDELGAPSESTATDWQNALVDAAGRVSEAAQRARGALGPAFENAARGARSAMDNVGEALGPLARRAQENTLELLDEANEAFRRAGAELEEAIGRRRESPKDRADPREPDDLPESERESDPEKAALLRKFEALEAAQRAKKNKA